MKRNERVVIIVGKTLSGSDEILNDLKNKHNYEVLPVWTSGDYQFGKSIKVNDEIIANNIEDLCSICKVGDSIVAVPMEGILHNESGKSAIVVPPRLADNLYEWAFSNSISPIIIHIESDDAKQALLSRTNPNGQISPYVRKNLDTIIEAQIGEMRCPTAISLKHGTSDIIDQIDALSEMMKESHTKIPNFIQMRQNALGGSKIAGVLAEMDKENIAISKLQTVSAGVMSMCIAAAGAPEVAVALFASYFVAKKGISHINNENFILKNEGFSLADRVKFHLFGDLVANGSNGMQNKEDLEAVLKQKATNQNLNKEENIYMKALSMIERRFDDVVLTGSTMRKICDDYTAKVLNDMSERKGAVKSIFAQPEITSQNQTAMSYRR